MNVKISGGTVRLTTCVDSFLTLADVRVSTRFVPRVCVCGAGTRDFFCPFVLAWPPALALLFSFVG